MEREESHREKWALGLSVTMSVFILVGFAFYRGFITINHNEPIVKRQIAEQSATVAAASEASSPISNTKEAFKAAFQEIHKKYNEAVSSVSAVIVPFVTGIDVYERK